MTYQITYHNKNINYNNIFLFTAGLLTFSVSFGMAFFVV